MAIPLQATGFEHCTEPARTRRTRTREFLTRGSRTLEALCVSQKHLAQHVARAYLVAFTFHSVHLHSNPTYHSTIIQTSIHLHTEITPALIHQMCLSVLCRNRHRLHSMLLLLETEHASQPGVLVLRFALLGNLKTPGEKKKKSKR